MSDEAETVSNSEPVPAGESDAQRTGTVRCSGWMCDLEAALRDARQRDSDATCEGDLITADEAWQDVKAIGRVVEIMRLRSHIDPKLSDGGGWRAGCTAGGKAAAEAASVTAGAVRCSAWLAVAVICEFGDERERQYQ